MARRGGLGPLGHAAIERAAAIDRERPAPVISERPAIGRNPSALDTRSPGEATEEPPVDWSPFDSSRVVEAGYDKDTQRLYVRFVKPIPRGTPWVYEGVPSNVWRNMKRSASAGKFVNRVLNDYDYHRGNF